MPIIKHIQYIHKPLKTLHYVICVYINAYKHSINVYIHIQHPPTQEYKIRSVFNKNQNGPWRAWHTPLRVIHMWDVTHARVDAAALTDFTLTALMLC